MGELSEYEKQRLANIEANKALLRKLQLDGGIVIGPAKSASTKSAKSSSASSRSHKRKALAKIVEDNAPRRTSSRLRGIEADSEVAKRKAEDEHDALQEAERAKRRRVSGDLNISDLVVSGKGWSADDNAFRDMSSWWTYKKSFTEKDIKATTDTDLKQMRQKMNSLKLYEGYEPNRKLNNEPRIEKRCSPGLTNGYRD
jgi:hypothetical protein